MFRHKNNPGFEKSEHEEYLMLCIDLVRKINTSSLVSCLHGMYFSLVARKEFPTLVNAVSFRAMSRDPYFIIIIIWLYSPSQALASPFWVL
jgi:hypothetical protein